MDNKRYIGIEVSCDSIVIEEEEVWEKNVGCAAEFYTWMNHTNLYGCVAKVILLIPVQLKIYLRWFISYKVTSKMHKYS